MCICGGVGEAAIIVVTSGLVARRLLKRKPKPPQVACLKCGATEKLMYNSYYCSDCYYGILDDMQYEKGCNDAPTNR